MKEIYDELEDQSILRSLQKLRNEASNPKVIWEGKNKGTPTIVLEENNQTYSLAKYTKPDPLPEEDKLYKWGHCEKVNENLKKVECHPNFYKGHNYTEEEIKCIIESEKLRYKAIDKEHEKKFLEEGELPPEPDMEKCLEIMDKLVYPRDSVYKEEPEIKSLLVFHINISQLQPDEKAEVQEKYDGLIVRLKKQGVESMWLPNRDGQTRIELIKF